MNQTRCPINQTRPGEELYIYIILGRSIGFLVVLVQIFAAYLICLEKRREYWLFGRTISLYHYPLVLKMLRYATINKSVQLLLKFNNYNLLWTILLQI
jgi:hypothetical protein